MKEKIFATLFTDIKNIHLIKDPGMIPLTFEKNFGYKSIIPIFHGRAYPYKDIYFKDIEMPILYGKRNQLVRDIPRTFWLIKNAKKIDVLNLFFFYKGTWFLMWLYKKLNPKGLIYVHVDTDGQRLIDFKFSKNPIKKYISKHILLQDFVVNSTLWGIQNSKNAKKLKGIWPFINVEYVPNGIYWEDKQKPKYEYKEDIMLTVARVGSPEKNDDKLINCFKKISDKFPNWKLRIVGPIEKSFEPFIEEFFKKNPQLKDRVELTGAIYDRNKLAEEYAKAKIFCLPSSWESFGISTIEALSQGCYVLESKIPANLDIVINEKLGTLFKNEDWDDLEEKMEICLDGKNLKKENFDYAINYTNSKFSWEKALEPVVKWVEEKGKQIK